VDIFESMATKKEVKKRVKLQIDLNIKKLLLWLLISLLFLPGLISFFSGAASIETVNISQVLADIKEEKIEKIEVRGDELLLYYKNTGGDEKMKLSRKEPSDTMVGILQRAGIDQSKVKVDISSQLASKAFAGIISFVAPILGFGILMYFLMRKRGGGVDMMFGFGKSKAKLFSKGKQSVKFGDVAGVDEAKKELEEVVDFLKNSKKYRAVGARTPKGVLLTGPSGVGKTLLAKAVAGEAGVPFFSMAGSEFMEMLVGVGASRVRDLFETAKKAAPAIIFIDEIDAIGRTRGIGGAIGGHDEREQTLNQILVEMDGFGTNDNVVVVAATNRPDVLDPALVRPGRFDRRVTLDLPDIAGRKDILAIHARGKPFEVDVDWDKVARRTVGFSGADLENMLNEAAIRAARMDRTTIKMEDLEEAATRVKLGPEKKRLQSPLERKMTAYHEAGHAVVGHVLIGTDPIHRVSIVSRGMALGYTMSQPSADKYQQTESELLDRITSLLGGRAAEKLVFNEVTAGAESDIKRATKIARAMVEDLGMSELGPVSFGPMWEMADWGRAYSEQERLSPEVQGMVDKQIKAIIDRCYKKSLQVLKKEMAKVDKLVERLLEVETVEQEEFEKIMGGKKVGHEEVFVG